MSISNQQYLDRLVEIGKELGKDERLPDDSRQLFSRASDLAETRRYDSAAADSDPLDQAFDVLCEACKAAGLHQCKEGQNGFLACQLVWNYSS
jgi:hypothetical protein